MLCVEWLDPLFLAGHWVPELVAAAGGRDAGAAPGSHSTRREWSEVVGLQPDLIVVMLCGFGVERSLAELEAIGPEARAALATAPVWILDGNAYTSRPGPRLVDGAERIAAALRGEEMPGTGPLADAASLRALNSRRIVPADSVAAAPSSGSCSRSTPPP